MQFEHLFPAMSLPVFSFAPRAKEEATTSPMLTQFTLGPPLTSRLKSRTSGSLQQATGAGKVHNKQLCDICDTAITAIVRG